MKSMKSIPNQWLLGVVSTGNCGLSTTAVVIGVMVVDGAWHQDCGFCSVRF